MLTDIESVAACMPGASITQKLDEQHYQGTVSVKIGPATMAFRGTIEVREQDAQHRTLRLGAKGTDTSGSSAASLDLTARVEAAAAGASALLGTIEASVSGRAAAFGGRMMEAVADQILQQFAANFSARVSARQRPPPGGGSDAASPAPASGPASPAAPRPLNGLALMWAVIRAWLRGLLARKTT
jgi:carbon monoxide dehydrogenase subunit G